MLDDSQNLLNVGVEQRGARKKNALFSYKPFSMNAEISVLLEEGYAAECRSFCRAPLWSHLRVELRGARQKLHYLAASLPHGTRKFQCSSRKRLCGRIAEFLPRTSLVTPMGRAKGSAAKTPLSGCKPSLRNTEISVFLEEDYAAE